MTWRKISLRVLNTFAKQINVRSVGSLYSVVTVRFV
jgi:hypothetical protein